MADVNLIEQLDEAVEAIIAKAGALPSVTAELAALTGVAAELRDLPRAEFKARLKTDLERRATMSTTAPKTIRQTVTPYLTAQRVDELIDFTKQAFGAEELYRAMGSGGVHAEVRIGDSSVMIGGAPALQHAPNTVGLHLYVPDADAVYKHALQAGAESSHEPIDQPYGDREAGVKDLVGNEWYIATNQATGHKPEGLRSVTPFLHPRGAGQFIDFLKAAFGAEEESRYESPDGVIRHATIRIGNSAVEMGEAHEQWQPMTAMFYLCVDDADACYARAIEAGAASISEPADQHYGDRVGAVKDSFGNQWYIAMPIRNA